MRDRPLLAGAVIGALIGSAGMAVSYAFSPKSTEEGTLPGNARSIEVPLPDGGIVICVRTKDAVSCDWEGSRLP